MKQYANETMCQCGNEEIKAKEQAKAKKVKDLKSLISQNPKRKTLNR